MPAACTVQPMCVQIALKQATVPAVGRETTIGLPSSVAFADPRTAIALSWAMASDDAELLDCGAAAGEPDDVRVPAELEAGEVEAVVARDEPAPADEDPLLQAAKAAAPAPVRPAASAVRRAMTGRGRGFGSGAMS